MKQFVENLIYCQVSRCINIVRQNCLAKENQGRRKLKLKNKVYNIETATDIVNQSLLLFDSSPLKAPMHLSSYTHDRTVKLGILTKPTFILNLLWNI